MKFTSLVELLQEQAKHHPESKTHIFLQKETIEEHGLTIQELELKALAIATYLQALRFSGEQILLAYPFGSEFIAAFFGCLYAGAIAVPAYPPRPDQSLLQLESIAQSCHAKAILTEAALLDHLQYRFAENRYLSELHLVATNTIPSPLSRDWKEPEISSDSMACLQYTSGSTGIPKGVMISHSCILRDLAMLQEYYQFTPNSRYVSWMPLVHVLGLVFGSILPIYGNFSSVMMQPNDFLERPVRWLAALSRYKGTISIAPNFAYDLVTDQVTSEDLATLDLSSWQWAQCAGELIQAHTVERFCKTFEPCGFRPEAFVPAYGMTENVAFISAGLRTERPTILEIDSLALEQHTSLSC